jgi:hypothetical protein
MRNARIKAKNQRGTKLDYARNSRTQTEERKEGKSTKLVVYRVERRRREKEEKETGGKEELTKEKKMAE